MKKRQALKYKKLMIGILQNARMMKQGQNINIVMNARILNCVNAC